MGYMNYDKFGNKPLCLAGQFVLHADACVHQRI